MALLNAEPCLNALYGYRLVWIGGRFGGHKTALAYRMAQHYLEQGYALISNNRTIWGDNPDEVVLDQNGHLKLIVILDEGGLYFQASKQIQQIAAYAAKMDVIYLVPSFYPPSRTTQVVTIQPFVSLKAAGIPVVIVKWKIRLGDFKDHGYFIWWKPQEIYGIYSRQDPGARPDQIVAYLARRTQEFRKLFEHDDEGDNLFQMEVTGEDLLQEAALAMAQAAYDFEAVSKRKNRRGRFLS